MDKPKVAIVKTGEMKGNAEFMPPIKKYRRYAEDVDAIEAAVAKAMELTLGSVDNLIKPGQNVLIKPNLAFNAPPESYAVVDPRTVEAVTRYFKQNSKAGRVVVGDNPSLGKHVGRANIAFKTSGMEEAARLGGADEVIYFDEQPTVDVDVPTGKAFKKYKVFKPFLDADVVINLPKMKVHLAKTVTLGLANWQGIGPNYHPSQDGIDGKGLHMWQQGQHRNDINAKVVDEYRIRKADWTIIDGVIAMEGQGPHAGEPVEMNMIVAGVDTVAVDAVAGWVMGFETDEISAIRMAYTEGLGERRMDYIDHVGVDPASVRRFFRRANNDPVGMYAGLDVFTQQSCPGCYVNIRGALDSFVISGIDFNEFRNKVGDCVFVSGGLPDFDPEFARGKTLFVIGDCWEYFPTSENIRQAIELAKEVIYRPGCTPVYIFSQINGDLQGLYNQAMAGD
ncbi:MAG: DUF362 domain-containing protein [Chloroflexi bacterium]|nr:DUF362 domain-containing protein [Anaerolineaceae bacterium]NMB89315.1 DUF362 domain-containing protein [Chloroflexota bacterium]